MSRLGSQIEDGLTVHNENTRYVPVDTCLAVLDIITREQLAAVSRLLDKPTAQRINLSTDSLYKGGLIFSLYGDRGPNDCFLHGLIEPDGSVNT